MAEKCLTRLRSIINASIERGIVAHNMAGEAKLWRTSGHDWD